MAKRPKKIERHQRARARQHSAVSRTAELPKDVPKDVEDYLQKFREWEESFRSPARRKAHIKQVCALIAEHYQPEKIVLFGSHAYGQPTPESDVDLLVVMDFEGSPLKQ